MSLEATTPTRESLTRAGKRHQSRAAATGPRERVRMTFIYISIHVRVTWVSPTSSAGEIFIKRVARQKKII